MLRSEGKLANFASGSTKWLRIVALGNVFLRQFARERGTDWDRYYNPGISIGTVTATDTFNIPSTVYRVSKRIGDKLRITHLDGVTTDYTLVPHNALKKYTNGAYAAKIGQTIKFNRAFTADDPQFGGSTALPCYEYPSTFSADGDTLDHDNPDWLITVVAADRVKNDVTRKDLRADLIAEANEIMMSLKEENDAQLEETDQPWSPDGHIGSDW